jgi:GNAT superfamily N-acetyltransferase
MATLQICSPDVDAFVELSFQLNGGDPQWMPPMRARLQQEVTGADAFGRYGRIQLFGCDSDGRLVGRIAAIVNPRLVDAGGHPVGQVGYFESVDDTRVSSLLFDAAFEWLRAAGAHQVWGPMNGGPHRTHRFITEGFERDPFLFEPRNPPHYPRLFESAGFSPIQTWFSTDLSSESLRKALASQPMLRVREATRRRYELERVNPSDAATVLRRLHALLDAMWTGHIGYTSLDFPEFVEIFAPALSLMTPGDVHIAVDRTSRRDVGCVFTLPDYSAEVRALNGDATGWGRWLHDGRRPRRLVLHTMGAASEARGTGIASAFVRATFEQCVEHYDEGVIALTIVGGLERLGTPTRRYALYGRQLA